MRKYAGKISVKEFQSKNWIKHFVGYFDLIMRLFQLFVGEDYQCMGYFHLSASYLSV